MLKNVIDQIKQNNTLTIFIIVIIIYIGSYILYITFKGIGVYKKKSTSTSKSNIEGFISCAC